MAGEPAARAQTAATRDVEHFKAGDSLRALSAVGGIFAHCALVAGAFGGLQTPFFESLDSLPLRAIRSVDVGVYIFFVLSGYLLGRPFVGAFIGGGRYPPSASTSATARFACCRRSSRRSWRR